MRLFFARMKRLYRTAQILLLALPMATAMAAPVGYSVNSDQSPGDALHQIDLATGASISIGTEVTAGDGARGDIEGLAFAPDQSLWAIDEERFTLFQIDLLTGTVVPGTEARLSGIGSPIFNDFGMTFTCDGDLYASSVTLQSLYHLNTEGKATLVGDPGGLGVNISAIAAYGNNPVRIYGLGNGLLGESSPRDNRSLYEIDPASGTVTLIGNIGETVSDYHQAGLSFDDAGQLWAITDRSAPALGSQPSEILRIDIQTGEATVVAKTNVLGFESLAVSAPAGCNTRGRPTTDVIQSVPAMNASGKTLGILVLMLTGLAALSRRII
jgi:hypothetical protein